MFDGIELTISGILFKKMVLVNMIIKVAFDKSLGHLKAIPDISVGAIFSRKDHSCGKVTARKKSEKKGKPRSDHKHD